MVVILTSFGTIGTSIATEIRRDVWRSFGFNIPCLIYCSPTYVGATLQIVSDLNDQHYFPIAVTFDYIGSGQRKFKGQMLDDYTQAGYALHLYI